MHLTGNTQADSLTDVVIITPTTAFSLAYCLKLLQAGLMSLSVTLPAGGRAGLRARGRSARRRPGAWTVWRPTLHGGPVRLRPVRATSCWISCHLFELLSVVIIGIQWVSIVNFCPSLTGAN